MGIESKYEYIYYTVINIRDWMHGNEEWFGDEFTWDAAVNFVQHKLKTSEDESVKKFIVEYAQYCDDIGFWRHRHIQHKEMPVFVKFRQDQEIKTEGQGDLFVIYEDDGVHYSGAEDDDEDYETSVSWAPGPDINEGSVDGLAGAGGRL